MNKEQEKEEMEELFALTDSVCEMLENRVDSVEQGSSCDIYNDTYIRQGSSYDTHYGTHIRQRGTCIIFQACEIYCEMTLYTAHEFQDYTKIGFHIGMSVTRRLTEHQLPPLSSLKDDDRIIIRGHTPFDEAIIDFERFVYDLIECKTTCKDDAEIAAVANKIVERVLEAIGEI